MTSQDHQLIHDRNQDNKEWWYEVVGRAGRMVILIYYGHNSDNFSLETRGSITCHNKEELEKWTTLILALNESNLK